MPSVLDVAQYILEKQGEMTTMKLQKLVYYSQAWHIAWMDNTLFPEKIEAWKDGPVCPDLFKAHAKSFRVSKLRNGNSEKLSDDEKDTVNRVLGYYGDKSPQWLSDLTHMENPWQIARSGLKPNDPSKSEITPRVMGEYYASL